VNAVSSLPFLRHAAGNGADVEEYERYIGVVTATLSRELWLKGGNMPLPARR
jgi:hypothetical protein